MNKEIKYYLEQIESQIMTDVENGKSVIISSPGFAKGKHRKIALNLFSRIVVMDYKNRAADVHYSNIGTKMGKALMKYLYKREKETNYSFCIERFASYPQILYIYTSKVKEPEWIKEKKS